MGGVLCESSGGLFCADFFEFFLLLGGEHFFSAAGASQRFHIMQNDAVYFAVKLYLNVFDAATGAEKCAGFGGFGFIG
jgi:hypothetical protein